MPRDAPSERHRWLLRRRSVLSHRQLKQLFVALCVPSLTVAAGFLWAGYWYILGFSVLELSVVALCLRHHARHAGDYDRIDITPTTITIEQRRALTTRRIKLDTQSAHVATHKHNFSLHITDSKAHITLGEFLPPSQRHQLSTDLARHLPQHD